MSNKSIRIKQLILITFCIILFYFLIQRSGNDVSQNFVNNVVSSTFVIDEQNFDEKTKLTGTYKYIEGELVTPEDLENYDSDKYRVSNLYNHGALFNGHEATLFLNIYNYTDQDLVLYLNDIINIENIYINGELLDNSNTQVYQSKENSVCINIEDYSKTELIIQITRDKFFIFGVLSPPTLMTYDYITSAYLNLQLATLALSLTILSMSIFMVILSLLRSQKLTKNKSVIYFSCIGLLIISRTILEYGIIHYDFIDIGYDIYIRIQSLFTSLIAYLLFLFAYYAEEQDENSKPFLIFSNYIMAIYTLFIFICPVSGGELLYKLGLLLILALEISSFFIARVNITCYKRKGILSFTVLAIFYIFVYTLPHNLFIYSNFNVAFAYIFSVTIINIYLIVSIAKAYSSSKYISKKQKVFNDITLKEFENINRQLSIEKASKETAIKIYKESRRRDAATGLFDRGYMSTKLSEMIENLKNDEVIALILLDIDNLKHINNIYGNDKADEIIVEISRTLINNKMLNEYISRWSGGTFLITLIDIDTSTASYVAERIRQDITSIRLTNGDNPTVSIGVCFANNKSSMQSSEVALNDALEIAKSIGKNCVYTDTSLVNNINLSEFDSSIKIKNPYTGELL